MNSLDENSINSIFALSGSFMKVFDLEESKKPYHINILVEIWANENAHSRILGKLLLQNSEKSFEILNSFLGKLTKFNQTILKPEITSEKDRIDLLILDKDFALIIENKIHNAKDQPLQLARYIENVKTKGYRESQIFVVYLTRDERGMPENQSWRTYKDSFSKRFLPLSYKEDILPWLKDHILPNCRIKDIYLKSTVEQYIDYLEGMFNSREIDKAMNVELEKHLKKALDLTSTPEKNLSKIQTKIQELNKVRDQLSNLIKISEKDCLESWVENIKRDFPPSDFPSLKLIEKISDPDYPKVGVKFEHRGLSFSILIESYNDTIYFGIHTLYEPGLLEDVMCFVKPLLTGFKVNEWWYGRKDTTYEDGYTSLKSLIEQIIQLTKN
ncbi:MAG: PD-(D/E)XK nuclease family protein [Mariniphaga sp.]